MRADLPPMASCNGCGECCGPVAARRHEAKRIKALLRENGESWEVDPEDPTRCGFLRKDGEAMRCAVYEARPFACRAFGVIQQMVCNHFPEEAVIDLPPQQAVYLKLTDPADRLIGEYFEHGYLERIGATVGATPEQVKRFVPLMRQAGILPYRGSR